jgi:hypothetical protein
MSKCKTNVELKKLSSSSYTEDVKEHSLTLRDTMIKIYKFVSYDQQVDGIFKLLFLVCDEEEVKKKYESNDKVETLDTLSYYDCEKDSIHVDVKIERQLTDLEQQLRPYARKKDVDPTASVCNTKELTQLLLNFISGRLQEKFELLEKNLAQFNENYVWDNIKKQNFKGDKIKTTINEIIRRVFEVMPSDMIELIPVKHYLLVLWLHTVLISLYKTPKPPKFKFKLIMLTKAYLWNILPITVRRLIYQKMGRHLIGFFVEDVDHYHNLDVSIVGKENEDKSWIKSFYVLVFDKSIYVPPEKTATQQKRALKNMNEMQWPFNMNTVFDNFIKKSLMSQAETFDVQKITNELKEMKNDLPLVIGLCNLIFNMKFTRKLANDPSNKLPINKSVDREDDYQTTWFKIAYHIVDRNIIKSVEIREDTMMAMDTINEMEKPELRNIMESLENNKRILKIVKEDKWCPYMPRALANRGAKKRIIDELTRGICKKYIPPLNRALFIDGGIEHKNNNDCSVPMLVITLKYKQALQLENFLTEMHNKTEEERKKSSLFYLYEFLKLEPNNLFKRQEKQYFKELLEKNPNIDLDKQTYTLCLRCSFFRNQVGEGEIGILYWAHKILDNFKYIIERFNVIGDFEEILNCFENTSEKEIFYEYIKTYKSIDEKDLSSNVINILLQSTDTDTTVASALFEYLLLNRHGRIKSNTRIETTPMARDASGNKAKSKQHRFTAIEKKVKKTRVFIDINDLCQNLLKLMLAAPFGKYISPENENAEKPKDRTYNFPLQTFLAMMMMAGGDYIDPYWGGNQANLSKVFFKHYGYIGDLIGVVKGEDGDDGLCVLKESYTRVIKCLYFERVKSLNKFKENFGERVTVKSISYMDLKNFCDSNYVNSPERSMPSKKIKEVQCQRLDWNIGGYYARAYLGKKPNDGLKYGFKLIDEQKGYISGNVIPQLVPLKATKKEEDPENPKKRRKNQNKPINTKTQKITNSNKLVKNTQSSSVSTIHVSKNPYPRNIQASEQPQITAKSSNGWLSTKSLFDHN